MNDDKLLLVIKDSVALVAKARELAVKGEINWKCVPPPAELESEGWDGTHDPSGLFIALIRPKGEKDTMGMVSHGGLLTPVRPPLSNFFADCAIKACAARN